MKRSVSLFILFAFTMFTIFTGSASGASDTGVFRLKSLGIIEEYDEEEYVTRAEAVRAFVRIITGEVFYTGRQEFKDVPADHKYAVEIYFAKNIDLINGEEDGTFSPDEPAIGMHIVKMAVITLGYREISEAEGGYEAGYINTAMKLGLFTGYELYEPITMGQFVRLLNKMLDMHPLTPLYGTSGRYELNSSATLYEDMMERMKMSRITQGIITAAGKSALNGARALRGDEISIDGIVYNYSGKDAAAMLGKNVTAYFNEEMEVITSILPKANNEEITIKSKDLRRLTKASCSYYIGGGRMETLDIAADASFLYNGINYEPADADIELKTGSVRLIDNNNDRIYEIVFIDEYESFIIDRVSLANTAVYFKPDTYFRGKASFRFDFDDIGKQYCIYNDEGKEIEFEEIAAGNVITISSSMGEEINIINLSSETVQGVVTESCPDEGKIMIDGKAYDLYKPNESLIYSKVSVGTQAKFYLNHNGEIVGTDAIIDGLYGYIIDAEALGLSGSLKLLVVAAGESEKEIEVSGDNEIIIYNYQNKEAAVLEVDSKIRYSGRLSSGKYVSGASIPASYVDLNYLQSSVIRYKLNSNGKICDMETEHVDIKALNVAPKYTFNGKLNSFGGLSSMPAFLVGDTTNVICVPNVTNPAIEDFYVSVSTRDKDNETVLAINVDEQTQTAECVVLLKAMNASVPKPFTDTTKYSIVGKVIKALDEANEGEEIYRLEVLTDKEFKTPFINASSALMPIVKGLNCGDIIRYNTKTTGEIANIEKVASIYSLSGYGENIDGTVFGEAVDIRLNRLDWFLNRMVDELTLNLDGYTKGFKIYREDGPVVYSYRKSNGLISFAETDEIMAGLEVFLLIQENVVKAVVVVKP